MRSLTETLSSLTVDELPLILPLLQRINQDIAANPTLPSLPRVFIALWTRIASSLHEEQVAAILLTSLSQFLEQSLQAHNFLPLETLCDRATLSSLLQDLGPKQFLKLLLPYMMELLLSNQTPSSIQDHLVTTISFLSSPRLLGPALTTRYLLPTLTVKTGSITFKRSDTMRPWSESTPSLSSLLTSRRSASPRSLPSSTRVNRGSRLCNARSAGLDHIGASLPESVFLARAIGAFVLHADPQKHPSRAVRQRDHRSGPRIAPLLLSQTFPLQRRAATQSASRRSASLPLFPSGVRRFLPFWLPHFSHSQ